MIEKLEKQCIDFQNNMYSNIDLNNYINLSDIKFVAGVDSAYWKNNNKEYAVCCIIVLDYKTHNIVEKQYCVDTVKFPYIPGCLAFREIPIFTKTYQKLKNIPDILFFDGNGYLHPRHMGLATHAGILIDKPTIGVAKSYYKINNTDYIMPDNTNGSYTNIIINGDIYGRALRTHKDIKPIFISIGNKIDIDTATLAVMSLVTLKSHIPLPTQLADIMTHQIRREIEN